MFLITEEIAGVTGLTGIEFEVDGTEGFLIEESDYNARKTAMGFTDKLETTEFEDIIRVKEVILRPVPARAAAAAPASGIDPAIIQEILNQANVAMRENIKLISCINKLKPRS